LTRAITVGFVVHIDPVPTPRVAPRSIPAVVLALVVVLVAVTTGAAAAAATPRHTYLAGGRASSAAVIRPHHVVLSGDSTLWLTHARWASWRSALARGRASTHWDDCKPNCATGKIVVKPAKITLFRARHVCGRWFFTRVRFHFTHGTPLAIPQNYVWNSRPVCA
jgi:hypothetical protein